MHLQGPVPTSVMEALRRVGARPSLKPGELLGGSQRTLSFPTGLVILCLLFHPTDLPSAHCMHVKIPKVTVTTVTNDLALVIDKVFPGHYHPLRELGFIPPILQVRKLSLERL